MNEKDSLIQNFKENLKKNLYKNTMKFSEKSRLIEIIEKKKLIEQDKEVLISILSKIPKKELNSLLGKEFINSIETITESKLIQERTASWNLLKGLKNYYDTHVLGGESTVKDFCNLLKISKSTFYYHKKEEGKIFDDDNLEYFRTIAKGWENSKGVLRLFENYHKDKRLQNAVIQHKYLSTGIEKILVSKFYDVIIRGHYEKGRSDASAERIIGRVIADKASEEGYSGFSVKAFERVFTRGKDNKFNLDFLEKYEFLFRFSTIFSESERKSLLEAIQEYRDKGEKLFGTDQGRDAVHRFLQKAYDLVKAIQKAYFKEHKKYISMHGLGKSIMSAKGSSVFVKHFFELEREGKRPDKFDSLTIFRTEIWAKSNLGRHFQEVKELISEWRIDNDDKSVYADQSTPLRKIAYSMLILHYEVYDEIISINYLDSLLKEFDEALGRKFFGSRFNNEYEKFGSLVKEKTMEWIKMYVRKYYMQKPFAAKQLIKSIDDYNRLPRYRRLKYSGNYINIQPYLLKNLIYITKGMNPLYCNFYEDYELRTTSSQLESSIKVVPHHINEDPTWDFIYHVFPDGDEYAYRFALAPLSFSFDHTVRAGNNDLHDPNFPQGVGNNLVEARMRHLLELDRMSYDKGLSRSQAIQQYYPIFKKLFNEKQDYIFQYGKDVNIWNEFEDGQIPEITDKNIMTFTEKWVDSKIMPERAWFNNNYKEFYYKKYDPFIKRVEKYCKENLEWGRESPFYEWLLNEYLPKDSPQ